MITEPMHKHKSGFDDSCGLLVVRKRVRVDDEMIAIVCAESFQDYRTFHDLVYSGNPREEIALSSVTYLLVSTSIVDVQQS
jgi:hypothetical protein